MKKTAKHTPGPWSYSEQLGGPGHCMVAQVWGPDDGCVARVEITDLQDEANANAKLIAAAPKMLEALRFIADRENLMFAECSDAEGIIRVAREAIAAADMPDSWLGGKE